MKRSGFEHWFFLCNLHDFVGEGVVKAAAQSETARGVLEANG